MTTCIFFDFQAYCKLPKGESALVYDAPIKLNRKKLEALEAFTRENPDYQFCMLSENSVHNKKRFLEAIKQKCPTLHARLVAQEKAIREAEGKDFLDSVTGGIYSNALMSVERPMYRDDDQQDGLKPWHKALAIRHVLRGTPHAFDTAVLLSRDESKRNAFNEIKYKPLNGKGEATDNIPGCAAVELIGEVGDAVENALEADRADKREADLKEDDRKAFESDAYRYVTGVCKFVHSSRQKVVLNSIERLGKVERLIDKYQLNDHDYDWRSLLEMMGEEKTNMVFGTFRKPDEKADLVTLLKAMNNSDDIATKNELAEQLNKAKYPGAVLQVLVKAWQAHHDQSWANYFGRRYLSFQNEFENLDVGDKAICATLMENVPEFKRVAKGRRGWSWRRPKSTLDEFQAILKRYPMVCTIPVAAQVRRPGDRDGYTRRR